MAQWRLREAKNVAHIQLWYLAHKAVGTTLTGIRTATQGIMGGGSVPFAIYCSKTRIHFFTCPVKPEVCPPDFCKHVCHLNTEVSKIMLRYIDLLSKETKTTISKLHQTKPLPVADCSSAGPSTRLWSLLTSVKRCLKFNVLLNEPRERKV